MMWQIDASQIDDPPYLNLIRAIQYFSEKYGLVPNHCELPLTWGVGINAPGGMLLTRSKSLPVGTILLALNPDNKTKLFNPR